MQNNNKEFYEYFYNRKSNSTTKSCAAKWEFFLLKSILKYAKKEGINNILEVGCGQGNKTAIISDYFKQAKIIGIDPSSAGIRNARENYSNYKNIEFVEYELNSFIEKSNIKKFDLVAALEILEHVDDWESLLDDIINVSNRYILLSFPTGKMRDYERHIGHLRNFKRGEVENFLDLRGFKIVKTFYSGFPFYTPLARDYVNRNYNNFMKSIEHEFTKSQEIFHHFVYLIFRYFTFKNIGDNFAGLFIKHDIAIRSNGGGVNYNIIIVILYKNYICYSYIYRFLFKFIIF